MHTGTLRKLALALTFWLALQTAALKAQIFTAPLQASTTGTNPVDFEFRADGTLIAEGNIGVGSLLTGDQGTGTRMLWFPSLGAFRAGYVDYQQWDVGNIGEFSIALGKNPVASGTNSVSIGAGTTASGYDSYAFGLANTASSTGTAAVGLFNTSSGLDSVTFGTGNTASGWYSLAMGVQNLASGTCSLALGVSDTASGQYSTAAGFYTTTTAYASFAVGMFNVGGGTDYSWVATDPLFEVGNGSGLGYGNPDITGPSDAFVVYKNGNAALQGSLTVAPSGDIPMFAGY